MVPVRAVGVRALLDFPDEIHFPSSPIKVSHDVVCTHPVKPKHYLFTQSIICIQYSSAKTILVRNVGDKEAKFTLHTQRYIHVHVYVIGPLCVVEN